MRTNVGGILCNPFTGAYRILSQSEALAVALCEGTHTLSEILLGLARLYRLPQELVRAQVEPLYAELLRAGVLMALPVPLPVSFRDYGPFVFVSDESDGGVHPDLMLSFGLQLTTGCLLSCVYCFADSLNASEAELMPTAMALRLLKEARQLGARYVILGGGEPLTHPDLLTVVGCAVETGFLDVQLSTKATSITRETASSLRRVGLGQVQVSLDSWDPEEVNRLSGRKDTYSLAVQGLFHLLDQGIRVSVRPTVTRLNAGSIPGLVRHLAAYGVESFRPTTVVAVGRCMRGLVPEVEQLRRLESALKDLQRELAVGIEFGVPRAGGPQFCAAGRLKIYVLANGLVVPCDVLATLVSPTEALGDVNEQTLVEVWTGERLRAFRRPRGSHEACVNCNLRVSCAGGCRVRAFISTGDMNEPDPRCCRAHPELKPGDFVPG